jgi:hypothetical protein
MPCRHPFWIKPGTGVAAGDEVWIGGAVYLEHDYCTKKGTYSDILRLDS